MFRDALNAHLERLGLSVAELSRGTGVPKTLLYKLSQKKVTSTNVEDAIKIANYFGMTVEEFVGLTEGMTKVEAAAALLPRLSSRNVEVVEVLVRALLASKD